MELCPDENLLLRLLAEELTPVERSGLEMHIEHCTVCQQTLERLTAATNWHRVPPVHSLAQPVLLGLRGLPTNDYSDSKLIRFLAPPQSDDELGRLGKYRILKVLGHGCMGVVFLAEDPLLKRSVALKTLLPSLVASEQACQRFLREAQAMAALEHDHIVRVYQADAENGIPFMAMELLKGEPLDVRLKREHLLPIQEAIRLGKETAEGLAVAHEKGLIHRDIKPGNLWLEGKDGRVKILDFGLARPQVDELHLTPSGAIVGTPAYMAPEQAEGKTLDARADLFSLGCVLYRLCTGEQPFKGDTTMNILRSLAVDDPTPPTQLRPEIPGSLSDLVLRLLAKNPDDRPASAAAVAEFLHALATNPQSQQVRHDQTLLLRPRPMKAVSSPKRGRLSVLLGLLVLLVALVGVGLWTSGVIWFQTAPSDRDGDSKAPDLALPPNKQEAQSRALLDWIVSKNPDMYNAKVEESGARRWVKNQIPKGPFKIREAYFNRPYSATITNKDLERLAACVDIEVLDFGGQPITAAGLAVLSPLVGLKRLALHGADVSPKDGAQTVRGFSKLEWFFGSANWVQHLEGMPSLRMVRFHRTPVTADVLGRFKRFPNLGGVHISFCELGEADLFLLEEIRTLRLLLLEQENVSDELLRRLAKEMPECEIRYLDEDRPPVVLNAGKGVDYYSLASYLDMTVR